MKYKRQLRLAQIVLTRSNARLPFALKSKMAELTLSLMRYRKHFGMFVILGWKTKWQRYADTPDISQDIFVNHHVNIMKITSTRQKKYGIMNTINFDGAILIDDYGNILHSGTMIEGLHPRATADKLNPHRTIDLSSQFGFKRKVHMRHITAITSSYFFKDIIVFTISEETNDFHIFKNGKIIYSTVIGEQVR